MRNLLIHFKSIAITPFQCSRQLANLLRKSLYVTNWTILSIAMRIRNELNNFIQKYEFNNHIYSNASVLLWKKIKHCWYSENGNRAMIKKNQSSFVCEFFVQNLFQVSINRSVISKQNKRKSKALNEFAYQSYIITP